MRYQKIKAIRKKLQNKQVSIGTWQQIPHSSISEILGKSGYDWVAVDMEHGSISLDQLPDLFRAIELGGTLPLVRLPSSTTTSCKQVLDAGAGGVIAPMIESSNQLNIIRDACCWPPFGSRGVGFSRANLFGKYFDKYKEEAQAPMLIAQIEHINAVNNLESILQVNGLDAIIIGPYDLSASMNLTAEFDNKQFLEAIDQIINLCKKYNVAFGDHVVQPNEGYSLLAYSIDAVFLHNSSKLLI